MRLKLEATPEEIAEKGRRMLGALAKAVAHGDAHLAEALHKAADDLPAKSEHRVLRDLQTRESKLYSKRIEAMMQQVEAAIKAEA